MASATLSKSKGTKLLSVDSSAFSFIGYNEEKKELQVIFKGNETQPQTSYTYSDFPYELYIKFVYSPSKGKFYHKYIKGNFEIKL